MRCRGPLNLRGGDSTTHGPSLCHGSERESERAGSHGEDDDAAPPDSDRAVEKGSRGRRGMHLWAGRF